MKYNKKIIFLVIFLLLVPGFLPYGFNFNKKSVKNNLSHAALCCCGNVASACRDCCCSEDHAETDNTGRFTVTITACGGTSDNIITVSKQNYFLSQPSVFNYLPFTTLAETATQQIKDVQIKPPYKPPKSYLLITSQNYFETTLLT